MKFTARLLWRAERDVDRILAWLNKRSQRCAASWLRKWDETFALLKSSADKYGLAPESEGQPVEIRQILFHTRNGRDYRALYIIQAKTFM